MLGGCVRDVLEMCWRWFRDGLGMFKVCVGEVLEMFGGCVRDVLGML